MAINKWEAFEVEQFIKEQPVDASVFTQKAADALRELLQMRATLAIACARQQQATVKNPDSLSDVNASVMPLETVSHEPSATCAA